MISNNCIIQWNPNGFYDKLREFDVLLYEFNPSIICVQETHFRPGQNTKYKNFEFFSKNVVDNSRRAHGGVSILARESVRATSVPLNTNLQAVAVKLSSPVSFTLCNIYIPENRIEERELSDLLNQLPEPFLILGDFNAHNTLWGSDHIDCKGRVVESVFDSFGLNLLNSGDHTRISSATGKTSVLDLTWCSPNLHSCFDWQTLKDTHGSDHFPILLKILGVIIDSSRRPKWKLEQANWPGFSTKAVFDRCMLDEEVEDIFEHMTVNIISAAHDNIPRTNDTRGRPPVPWFDDEIKEAIRNRRRYLQKLNRGSIIINEHTLIEFKRLKAVRRRLSRQKSKQSLEKYLSSIDSSTSTKEAWSKINRFRGKHKARTVEQLKTSDELITNPVMIAEEFGATFAKISNDSSYTDDFKIIKESTEEIPLALYGGYNDSINSPFSMEELDEAISSGKSTSPGPDDITNDMLKYLSIESKTFLLNAINKLWTTRAFVKDWRRAISIPVLKPGKDPTSPLSYRPIQLTSCFCKTVERMVNKRLTFELERRNLLSPYQFGFRKMRSTADPLNILESEIQIAFANKEHLVAVELDIHKAYDCTWRRLILNKLWEWGFRGNILFFIDNLMKDRIYGSHWK